MNELKDRIKLLEQTLAREKAARRSAEDILEKNNQKNN